MALPPPQESAPDAPARDLPAAYRNPWQTLGENLRAVVADTGLRAREIWRRNGQGSLWRPSWWPADLAPLFWPLCLALAAALFIAASALLPASVPVEEAPLAQQAAEPAPEEPVLEQPLLEQPAPVEAPPPELPQQPGADPLNAAPTAADEPEQLESAPMDPLAALLQRPEADGLLIAARVLSDQVSLVLELAPRFASLSSAEQQRRAEQWQQWAADLGYDHLELRDSRSGLLARDALVGSGMIVLSEPSRP